MDKIITIFFEKFFELSLIALLTPLFSGFAIWYSNFIKRNGENEMSINPIPSGIERRLHIESVPVTEKANFYKKWFWRCTGLSIVTLILIVIWSPLTGTHLKEGYDWLIFIPIFTAEAYFLTLFYFEKFKSGSIKTWKILWFSILAFILGAIGVQIIGFLSAYIWQ